MTRLRTLVVDDSVAFRTAMVMALRSESSIDVIGEAGDGDAAVEMAERLLPDVISMDVIMPKCNGIEAAQRILSKRRIPIVLLSTMSRTDEHWMALNALRLGVLDVANKPVLVGPTAADELRSFIAVLHSAASALTGPPEAVVKKIVGDRLHIPRPKKASIIAIGASTGGPAALERALGALAPNAPPVVVAQHVAPNLGASLAKWLSGAVSRTVEVVERPMSLQGGHIYMAHDRLNIEVAERGIVKTSAATKEQHVAPNVNTLLQSVAERYADRAIGVILTGMGSDGSAGLKALRAAGAWTVAQDKQSSIVYGMPLAAFQSGACQEVLELDAIRDALSEIQFDL